MNTRNLLRKIPWKIALPTIMLAVTCLLFDLDTVWSGPLHGLDAPPITSARGAAAVIDGPVSIILAWRLPVQLVGVALFWAGMGLFLDRRMDGLRKPLFRNYWLRLFLNLSGFFAALLCLLLMIEDTGVRTRNLHYLGGQVRKSWGELQPSMHHPTFAGDKLFALAVAGWTIAYLLYFGVKVWRLTITASRNPS